MYCTVQSTQLFCLANQNVLSGFFAVAAERQVRSDDAGQNRPKQADSGHSQNCLTRLDNFGTTVDRTRVQKAHLCCINYNQYFYIYFSLMAMVIKKNISVIFIKQICKITVVH